MDEIAVEQRDQRELLQARWQQAWPASWHDAEARADMIDRHAWLHAASSQHDGSMGGRVDLPSWSASTSELAEQIVREELAGRAVGPFAPVVALPGAGAPRLERSRPAWHLRGAAARVPWSPTPRALLVAGLDEGDNAVIAVVEAAADGVTVECGDAGTAAVRFDDVTVPERHVTHAREAVAALSDRVIVLALMALVSQMEAQVTSEHAQRDVALSRAAVRAALRSAGSARQHDVSAAAVVVLLARGRLGLATEGVGHVSWHRERLAPLL